LFLNTNQHVARRTLS